MKRESQLVLDDRDLAMVELLVQLGLARNPAQVLVFLAQVDEALSQQIEQGAGMRQPEVSVAVRELRRRGWVAKRDVPTEGKGRPMHCYRLEVPFGRVVDRLEEQVRAQAREALERVERLRGMANGLGGGDNDRDPLDDLVGSGTLPEDDNSTREDWRDPPRKHRRPGGES